MFVPLRQTLIEEPGIVSGQSVLEVAGGPGEPSLTIAGIVGLAGSVRRTDAVAEMVGAAESAAQRFFPDPLVALREILRVTEPGGTISLAVWAQERSEPFRLSRH